MKNKIFIISLLLLLLLAMITVFNMKAITRQGINYHVTEIEIPLYLKVLNFFDRHFNYKWLAKRITNNQQTKEEKVFRLFQWTHETIQPQPESLPVMDDHVWNVYVRGYGVSDNFQDLFTTLCNYIGVDSFFLWLKAKDNGTFPMSFVKLDRGWVMFDPYKGVYFFNSNGEWATVEDINKKNWEMKKIGSAEISDSFYKPYLNNLPNIDKVKLGRANTQSPFNRLLMAIQQLGF
jgi:hypothetical protein